MTGYFSRLARNSTGAALASLAAPSKAIMPPEQSVGAEATAPPASAALGAPETASKAPPQLRADKPTAPGIHAPLPHPETNAAPTAEVAPRASLPRLDPITRTTATPSPTHKADGPIQSPVQPEAIPQSQRANRATTNFVDYALQTLANQTHGTQDPAPTAKPEDLAPATQAQPAARVETITPDQSARHTPTVEPRATVAPNVPAAPALSYPWNERASREDAPRRAPRSAPSRQVEVRIGSLRIEVTPPPPATTAFSAPQPNAPAAKEAPREFRASRHYLRPIG